MDHCQNSICRGALILSAGTLVLAGSPLPAQQTQPVGNTKADQERNAELLGADDYVGEMEIARARWREGFRHAETIQGDTLSGK